MSFPARFNVTSLNGTNGFAFVDDLTDDWFGQIVSSLGDVNKDGKSDLIASTFSGRAYVLFGSSHRFSAQLPTSSLNGENGFRIICSGPGVLGCAAGGIGDVNGDDMDDLSVGSCNTPEAYVIFGTNRFPAVFNVADLNGRNGFKIIGHADYGFNNVASIGDVNGDGQLDFILSNAQQTVGRIAAFVVYGAAEFPSILDLSKLDGVNGFTIVGLSGNSHGVPVSGIGDFNGDTRSDFIAGTSDLEQAFIIFGANKFPGVVNTSSLDGANGFTVIGLPIFGQTVAGVGDVNGDDLLYLSIGCPVTDEAFLIFGAARWNATFDVRNLDGSNGVKLIGPFWTSAFGFGLAGIDSINHNGKSGVIVGTPQSGANGAAGSALIFFGMDHFPPELHASSLNGTNGFEIVGPLDAGLGVGVASINNFTGTGEPAIIVGAVLANVVYVVLDASTP